MLDVRRRRESLEGNFPHVMRLGVTQGGGGRALNRVPWWNMEVVAVILIISTTRQLVRELLAMWRTCVAYLNTISGVVVCSRKVVVFLPSVF